MDREEARLLASATRIWRNLQGLLRLTVGRSFEPEAAPEALMRRLARTGQAADFPPLARNIEPLSEPVRAAFARHIGQPARTDESPSGKGVGRSCRSWGVAD